jgi:hypothetical protein
VVFPRLDAEQVQEFVLPLANQRLWNNEQNALRALGTALRNYQTSLDGLAQADLIGKDTAALAETPERKNDGINLVWIRVDSRLPLGRGVALAIVRSTDPDQILGEHPQVEPVQ